MTVTRNARVNPCEGVSPPVLKRRAVRFGDRQGAEIRVDEETR